MKNKIRSFVIPGSVLTVALLFAACGASPSTVTAPSSSSAASVASSAADTSASAADAPASASSAPASSEASASASASTDTGLKTFTVDELAKYDGQKGNPAYIAVDGNVYDVSGVGVWKNGSHFGKYFAGKDLSKEILLSPHGKSKLDEVPLVGTLQ